MIWLILVSLPAFLQAQKKSDSWKIRWDTTLMKGREEYLSQSHPSSVSNRPNIILILADDLGQTDISLYGSKLIRTPNIDAIGNAGATFTEGYISSPVCSPSRAGLMTGRYQQRFGHELQPNYRYVKNGLEFMVFKLFPGFRPLTPAKGQGRPTDEDIMRQGLPPSEITMAEVLRTHGYATGIIGKWHLGAADFALPCNRGFEFQYGFSEAFTLYADRKDPAIVSTPVKGQFMDAHQWREAEGRKGNCAITRNCCEPVDDPAYLTDKLTDEAISFISRNASQPFFLYLPYNAPHAPLQAQKKYEEEFAHIADPVQRTYLAMIRNLDDQVGRLMRHLDSCGLSGNTLVFFLSDNGGAAYNGTTENLPYRGGKLTNFEGGIRVPFMMRWSGHVAPGTVYHHPVISLDVFTTACRAAGIGLPADREYDGSDLVDGIRSGHPVHEALYWRSDGNKAVRKGEWKYIENPLSGSDLLYDMRRDSSETQNLVSVHPEVVSALRADLARWESRMSKPLWPRVVNYIWKDRHGRLLFAF